MDGSAVVPDHWEKGSETQQASIMVVYYAGGYYDSALERLTYRTS